MESSEGWIKRVKPNSCKTEDKRSFALNIRVLLTSRKFLLATYFPNRESSAIRQHFAELSKVRCGATPSRETSAHAHLYPRKISQSSIRKILKHVQPTMRTAN